MTLEPKALEAAIAAHDRILAIPASHGDKILITEIISAYLAALPAKTVVEGLDETGWLVELRGDEPKWWSMDYNPEPDWTKDASRALRFARKDDADAYIGDIGWTEAFASEHMWPALSTGIATPKPEGVKALVPARRLEALIGLDSASSSEVHDMAVELILHRRAALAPAGDGVALSKEVQASEAVAVKPLEWRNGYRDVTVTIYQASFGGLYQVRVIGDGIWLDWPDRGSSVFSTIEAAKAAAQADFEQRIRSALAQSTPVGEGKQP